jgi:hypothetical protein
VGITTRVYNRGIDAPATDDEGHSLFPLVLATTLTVLAILFANPILPAPLFIALWFVRGVFSDWRIWVALIVAVVGISGGAVMTWVYSTAGVFF